LSHDLNVNGQWRDFGLEGLTFYFGAGYHQGAYQGVLEEDFLNFERLQSYTFGPSISYELNRLKALINFQYTSLDYFSRVDEIEDYDQKKGSAFFTYQLTEKGLAAFAGYTLTDSTRPNASNSDYYTQEETVGVQGSFRKFNFKLGFEESMIHAANSRPANNSGPGGLASLTYTPNDLLVFNCGASYLKVVGPLEGSSNNAALNAGLLMKVSPSQQVNLFSDWLHEDYIATDVTLKTLHFGFNYNWQALRRLKISAGFEDFLRTYSNAPEVRVKTGTLNFTLQF
jgi:hypothetical protein